MLSTGKLWLASLKIFLSVEMKYILILLANVNGHQFVSQGWEFTALDACKAKAVEVVLKSQPTATFSVNAMCIGVWP